MAILNNIYVLSSMKERFENTEELKDLLVDPNNQRILKGKRKLGVSVLAELLDIFNFPKDTLTDSKLTKFPMKHTALVEKVKSLLENEMVNEANELFLQIEKDMVKSTLLKQEMLSLKAQLWFLQNRPAKEILALINEGLRLTFIKDADALPGKFSLMMFEPELIYTKALVIEKEGEIDKAIDLLLYLETNLINLSKTDKSKRKLLCYLYLTLCSFLYKAGRYKKVLEYSVKGSEQSVNITEARYIPDYSLLMAKAKHKLSVSSEQCRIHLMHAYAGYFLLGEIEKAEAIITTAQNEFGLTLELYGMEKLYYLVNHPVKILSRGISVDCNNLVEMIDRLCTRKNIHPSKIYEGIISRQAYSKSVNGNSNFGYFNAEAMGQRLGVDISVYDNFMLGDTDYEMLMLRDEILERIFTNNGYGDEKLLERLKFLNEKRDIKVIEQFIDFAYALLSFHSRTNETDIFIQELVIIMQQTQPDFNLFDFSSLRLTRIEFMILNRIGGFYIRQNSPLAARLYSQLITMHKRIFTDEVDGHTIIRKFYNNYSTALSLAGNTHDTDEIIRDGINYIVSSKSLISLNGIFNDIGIAYSAQGKNKEEAVPFHVLSYFASGSMAPYITWCKTAVENAVSELEKCEFDIAKLG